MRLLRQGEGWAEVALPFRGQLAQPAGIAHGGALASLADSAAAIALSTLLDPQGQPFLAAELRIRYLAPFGEGEARALARVARRRGRLARVEVEVVDARDRPLARAVVTFLNVRPRDAQAGGRREEA